MNALTKTLLKMKKEWEKEVIERCNEWNVGKVDENWKKWEELMYREEEVEKPKKRTKKQTKKETVECVESGEREMKKENTGMEEEEKEKERENLLKKRCGRPKKKKEVLESSETNDLFSSLIENIA